MLVPMFSSRERALVGVAVGARVLGVDADDVEVERVAVARVARERRDPRQVGHGGVVGLDVAAADLGMRVDLVQLAERDRGEDVGEVRLEAGGADVVERAVAPPHQAQLPHLVGERVVVGRDRAALARGDVLRRVEGEARRARDRADPPAAVARLDGVGRVLDHRQPEREERVEVGGLAREVDRAGSPSSAPVTAAAAKSGSMFRSESRTSTKTGVAPRVDDDVGRRGPSDRRRDHLVAGPEAQADEGEVHGGRARGDGQRMARAASARRSRRSSSSARGPLVSQPLSSVSVDRGDLLRRRSPAAGRRGRSYVCWRTAASSVSKRIESAARPAFARASSRDDPVARTKPARSEPRRKGPKTKPGRR